METKEIGATHMPKYWVRCNSSQMQQDSPNSFIGYTDATYANTDDLKSTSGYVFIIQGGAITWWSKKQSVIAMSSTEAEYVALSEAMHKASWLRQLFSELGFKQEEPTLI